MRSASQGVGNADALLLANTYVHMIDHKKRVLPKTVLINGTAVKLELSVMNEQSVQFNACAAWWIMNYIFSRSKANQSKAKHRYAKQSNATQSKANQSKQANHQL
jgi:hypothetical protein